MLEYWLEMKIEIKKLLFPLVFSLACASVALALDDVSQQQQTQTIKRQALELNRDLFILEEELLFPDDSRLAVYLSLDTAEAFPLNTVTLSIDGKQVMHHQYSEEQLGALQRGGAHLLYMGNLETGTHQLVASFAGTGAENRDYRGMTELSFEKTPGARTLDLQINGATDLQQAEFSVVDSLHYRSALFYYFQQDYFATLTELMAAQQLEQVGAFNDKAELLRGGASLSYGMEQAAQQIFEKLLAEPGASADRDRAWFYLGKLAWQRGALDRAAAALEKIAPTYHGELAAEANFMRASISLRQGHEQLAASYDTLLPADSPWLYYLYYNLGANHAASGDRSAALEYFERIVQSPLSSPEMNSLRDKALTASGYTRIATKNYEQAASDFARVRLDSPLVDRALLGYGWAYSGMDDYRAAITPWQALAQRSLVNDSVREGLLALPYAHEQLGQLRTALAQYRQAGEVYTAEVAKVQAAIAAFRDGDPAQQLALVGENSQGWLNARELLLQGDLLPYLSQLMTRQNVQLAMRELRDLQSTAQYLSSASQRLQALSLVDVSERGGLSPTSYATRIRALQERVRSEQLQVQAGLAGTRAQLREQVIADLEQQARKLHEALGQSRLAVTRMYELGSTGGQQ
jgi:hypothetical protein